MRDDLRDWLDPEAPSRPARLFRVWQFLAVFAGIGIAIASSVDEIWASEAGPWLVAAAGFVLVAFAVEYGVRLALAGEERWIETESVAHACRRYAQSGLGIIDLLSVLPMALALAGGAPVRLVLLGGVLWMFKLARYSHGLIILGRVVKLESEPLTGVLLAFMIALFLAATLAYMAERAAQPDHFGSLPKALWWAIVTLTTTGYGDAVPITGIGRVVGGLVMMSGILLFALWAGILATGFSEEVRRREFLRTYDLVHKVPFFHDLGASVIAELARLLKPREYPAGATVVRRGQNGDCMYFIVSGEIEIRTEPKPLHLHSGSFFGEIALITGGPRTATAIASKRTVLLLLDIADFRDLAARRPALAQAIHGEAERRQRRMPFATAD
ncbi:MAG: cyclic nucleotide-binding domain-containing protein [Alphaproteobacteria bacterium]|nr:cyclic nucleotide-binding domain-containing protein [Alphaproteobacteria bacterium]